MPGTSKAQPAGCLAMPAALREELVSRSIILPDCAIKPLTGGHTNNLWQAESRDGPVVVKSYSGEGSNPLFANSPGNEAHLLRHLQATGLAPALVETFQHAQAGVLIYSLVRGRTWQSNPAIVASAFERLHSAPLLVSLPHAPDGSAQLAKQTFEILSACKRPEKSQIASLKPQTPVASSGRMHLLHGDPVPGNLIAHRDGITFIDWQCPQIGDPVNDLALFLSPAMQLVYRNAALTTEEKTSFFSAFKDTSLKTRFAALAPWYHWRMAAYCLWRCENGCEDYRPALALELSALAP